MSISISDLLCCEDSSNVLSRGGDFFTEYSSELEFNHQDDEESIAVLLEDERDLAGVCVRSTPQTIDASVRTESVAWIIKVQRYYCFQPLTAYLSVNYFDRFLQFYHLPKMNGWAEQLLSIACLSLAAKMEEPLVPSLLDFQVEGAKFFFEPRTILRMELLVLKVLNWRLRSISPFCYLGFLALKIDPTGTYTDFLASKAKEIILSSIQEASFLEHRPSSIAAATILCAAEYLPKFSLTNSLQGESWCDGLHKESITSCHQLIQQLMFNIRPKKQSKLYPQVTVKSQSCDSLLSSSSSPSPSTLKRRKLSKSLSVDEMGNLV